MTRKGFFRSLFGMGSTGVALADVTTHKDGWRRFISTRRVVAVSDCRNGRYIPGTLVFLDHEPVSDTCCFAEVCDDGFGRVILYLKNKEGNPYMVNGYNGFEVAQVMRYGQVRILRPSGVTAVQWERLQKEWLQG